MHLQNSRIDLKHQVSSFIAIDRTPELLHLLDYAFDLHFSRGVVIWRSLFHTIAKDKNYDKNKGNRCNILSILMALLLAVTRRAIHSSRSRPV